ncbi:MAG: hypothetical protein KDK66_01520, partial [Deltaproteobacteria bacterium]|nr:hypothetical protein [Deltaproteobacteria bacterium]
VLALKAGEKDEKIVENVISKSIIEEHEELAESFIAVSGALVLLLSLGLLQKPKWGPLLKGASLVGVSLNLILVSAVGHSGGELVYKHDAAAAHINAQSKTTDSISYPEEDE